jgi:transcriptional regulator with XRE-family HTH domain
MAANTALREARRNAHLSQGDLARRVRDAGFMLGYRAPCSERLVQRWESGQVTRPQARYLLALEAVLGQPADSLGFDADRHYGMDREALLAEAGIDMAMPLPEPNVTYGRLTGIWLSEYEYPSSSRGRLFRNRHYVLVLQRGARLMVRSVPASSSQVSMDLKADGQVVTGNWVEKTEEGGYYRGAAYSGALQFLVDPTGHRMEGQWVGFGRNMKINNGEWVLTLIDSDVSPESSAKWNRVPEGGGGNG